eukprot:3650424-Amphidinium_carterae.2
MVPQGISEKLDPALKEARALAEKLEPHGLIKWLHFLRKHGFTVGTLGVATFHEGVRHVYNTDPEGREGLKEEELNLLYHVFVGRPEEVQALLSLLQCEPHLDATVARSIDARAWTLADLLHLTPAEARELAGNEAQYMVLKAFLDKQRRLRAVANLT